MYLGFVEMQQNIDQTSTVLIGIGENPHPYERQEVLRFQNMDGDQITLTIVQKARRKYHICI